MWQHGAECGVAVNYDAEQFNIQPIIDTLVLDAMRRHNRSGAHVLNTYQCYLKVRTTGSSSSSSSSCNSSNISSSSSSNK